MKRLLLLSLLLSACGSDPGSGSGQDPEQESRPVELGLNPEALNGRATGAVLASLIPSLAKVPGPQSRASLARALDEKWKIECESNCRIERK